MKEMKRFLTLVLFSFLSLSILACNDLNYEAPTGDNVGSFRSYDDLKEYLSTVYNSSGDYYYSNEVLTTAASLTDAALGAPQAGGAEDAERDFSKSNDQVDGVQESDRILTDGYKIYIVSGNKFFIVDSETLNVDYEYEFMEDNTSYYTYGYLDNMYLYEGNIVLTSYIYSYEIIEKDDCVTITSGSYDPDDYETTTVVGDDATETIIREDGSSSDEYYYYDCYDYNYSYGTKVVVLDVEDSLDVTVARELYFESAYLSDTRMIDGTLYMILDNYMIQYGYSEDLYIPRYMDSAVSDDLVNLPANRIFFLPNDGQSYGYLMLVSFDVADDEAVNVKAYLGSTYQIYMSQNNLYTIINKWTYNEETLRYDYFTYVVRFEIEDKELVYKAIGTVSGSPLNQFSMDEYDGVFRIATTGYSYNEEDWSIDNYMFLLDATTDDEMEQVSMLSGLGKPGERIYSVRFNEELAYVVTFVQTDPLYKLDLSDPQVPVIVGELYEEGVSDYLHIINDNLLLGTGRSAITEDGWTRFTGVKVALYDTTGDTPLNLETYLVEGQYSYTNVMWDHKSFVHFTPIDADFTYVAIPVYEYFEDYWGYSQSLYVFKVFHNGDLELVSKLTHMVQDDGGNYPYYDSIERAVMIDNYIYTVSFSSIKKFNMDNEFTVVNSQELNTAYYSIWGYPMMIGTDAQVVD